MTEQEIETISEEEEPLPESARVEFPCENCAAGTRWDPDADALLCDHCGHKKPVPRAEGTIVERSLDEAGQAARGFGLEVRIAKCGNCGAQVSFDDTATSKDCVYCGSSSVLEQQANRNTLRPESLVPLDVGRDSVEANFRAWLGGLWFRPNALKDTRRRFDAVGVYVPFWTFDCAVHSDWSADAGHYYYVTQHYWATVNGKRVRRSRRVRKVRWVPAWGQRYDEFDDLLILACDGQSGALVRKLGRFDTKGLVPYRPEYLAGWRAGEYSIDLTQGWEAAKARVEDVQKKRCAGDVPGDTHRRLRVLNHLQEVRWKHVLLPMWSLTYRYKQKTYTVLVHGQSGKVVGEAPYSWLKILALVGAVGTVVLAAALFVAVTQ
ncbi:MAG: primosomal protein N' (replication factor Y) - superfamily II helicase [Planctomycetota bacterium]